jgi:hypothetical protein
MVEICTKMKIDQSRREKSETAIKTVAKNEVSYGGRYKIDFLIKLVSES